MSFKACPTRMAYWLIVCALVVNAMPTAWARVRARRSDDTEPLEAVVEHLSQQVGVLTAQLTSVNSEVAALRAKTATLDRQVAFHAWSYRTPAVQTAAHGIIVLGHASLNAGHAYNTVTGVFTAPVPGLYDFQATIMSSSTDVSTGYVYGGLYVDSAIQAKAMSDNRHGYHTQSTFKCVVHLDAGQKVYLKNMDNRAVRYTDNPSEPYTTFSGFLIKAD